MATNRQQPPQPPAPLMGGPGEEPLPDQTGPEATPPASLAGTSIRINGREFTVDPEIASALESRETEFNRRLSEQGRELGELRTWRRQAMEQPQTPPQGYDYDTALFERPRETLQRVKEEVIEQVRREYRGEQQQQRAWNDFYRQHSDLADEDRLVRAIAAEMLQEEDWAQSRDMKGFLTALADRTRGELLRITRKAREADAPAQRLPSGQRPVEGGGTRRAAAPAAPETPATISDIIQARQAERTRARTRLAE